MHMSVFKYPRPKFPRRTENFLIMNNQITSKTLISKYITNTHNSCVSLINSQSIAEAHLGDSRAFSGHKS